MALTPEGIQAKSGMITGILLAELPPGRAEVLFARIQSLLHDLDSAERTRVVNQVSSDLHDLARSYQEQWPEYAKKFVR